MKRWATALVALIASAAWAPLAAGQADVSAMAERLKVRYDAVPRKVLAFYYPWYGSAAAPGGSGRDAHWGKVAPAAHAASQATNFPELGAYDSHDPNVIARHCRWARQAGIDGWIVSWWGQGSFEDQAMPRILDAAAKAGLDVTVYYETTPAARTPASAADNIQRLLDRYAAHKAWLRVDGKPVVFVYGRAVGELGADGWLEAIVRLNRQYKGGAVLIGDQLTLDAARIFDGIHTYNPAGSLRAKDLSAAGEWAGRAFGRWVALADWAERISTVTVIPGYDDTKIRKPGLAVDREDGRLYETLWKHAIAAAPDWVLITSFNEWHEGSEVEPSFQDGRKYLELTNRFAGRFKALGPRGPRRLAAMGPVAASRVAALAERLDAAGVGVLEGARSEAIWWLIAAGAHPRVVMWKDLVSQAPSLSPMRILLYAGDEKYRQSVRAPGDVDAALRRYLAAGGMLLAMPSAPMPLHYNERDEVVGTSAKVGLPLSVAGPNGGWEKPPEGVKLRFVKTPGTLDHLTGEIAFDQCGQDPRWRPLVAGQVGQGKLLRPLLRLTDERGGTYGLGAALIDYRTGPLRGGKVMYLWFGLLQHPTQTGPLLYDLLDLAAREAKGTDGSASAVTRCLTAAGPMAAPQERGR